MKEYTYSDELYSDLHKDAYGFRPTSDQMIYWASLYPSQKQTLWDDTINDLAEEEKRIAKVKKQAELNFKAQVKVLLSFSEKKNLGDVVFAKFLAHNKLDIRKMSKEEIEMLNWQDLEMFLYDMGILFTDYGKFILDLLECKLKIVRGV